MNNIQEEKRKFNRFIVNPQDLVTAHSQTRAGFLQIALEKNMLGDPYVKNALAFKTMAAGTLGANELLYKSSVRPFMLTAAGLSGRMLLLRK